MPFHITCVCGRLTVVPENQVGQLVRCSRCDRELRVPELHGPVPPAVPDTDVPVPPPVTLPGAGDEPVVVVDTAAAEQPRSRRDQHHLAVQNLVLALVTVALLSGLPVVLAVVGRQGAETTHLERWAFGILLAGILQLVYALYLFQLPDWSSVWVVSLLTLCIATAYAGLMGIRLLASQGNRVIEFLELDGNRFSSGQEAGWCLIMVLLMGTLSYLAGRFGTNWYRAAHGG